MMQTISRGKLLKVLKAHEADLPAIADRQPKLVSTKIHWDASLLKKVDSGELVLLDRSIYRAILKALGDPQ